MARRVLLYIGLPKTGTTFIQTTMWHNRTRLEEQGFLYPGEDRFDHYHAFADLRRKRRDPGSPKAPARPMWDALVSALNAWDGDGLITHEFFSMLTPAQIGRALADIDTAEIQVIITARSYVAQWPAVWQEGLKMNVDQTFDEFMAAALSGELKGAWGWRSQDILKVLSRWERHVPREQIHVVTVPPPGSPRNLLWDRWVKVTGIDDSNFETDVAFANSSLGAEQAALLHALKPRLSAELLDGPTRHRWVRQYFGHEVLVPQRGTRFGPRPEVAEELAQRSEQAARTIEHHGYPVTGDLADLTYRPEPGAADALFPDDVTTEQMLEVALDAIEQMIRDQRRVSLQRDRLRSKGVRGIGSKARKATRKATDRALRRGYQS